MVGSGESAEVKPKPGNAPVRSFKYQNNRFHCYSYHQLEEQNSIAKICAKAAQQCKDQEDGGTQGELEQM